MLGVPSGSDAYTLLGLSPDRCSAAAIDEALRLRIGRVYRHPQGRSAEGVDVLRALRRAAAQLRNPAVRATISHESPLPPLTPFDRQVLAILIGYGGWNAASRARLVALAAEHGVSAMGLLQIIRGLSRHTRSSRRQIDLRRMSSTITRPPTVASDDRSGPMFEMAETLVERFAPALRQSTTRATLVLSAAFGGVAIILAVIVVILVAPDPVANPPANEAANDLVASSAVASARASSERAADDATPPSSPRPSRLELDVYPTFSVSAAPPEAIQAAEAYGSIINDLDAIARRLAVDSEPPESLFHAWSTSLQTAAAGWLIAEEQSRLLLDRRINEVLRLAASAPKVSDRLLSAFVPPTSRLTQSIDVARGAWRVGTLGRLASHPRLPPVIIDQAGTRLSAALIEALPPGRLSFNDAALTWLEQMTPALAKRLEFDAEAYVYWELWLATVQSLEDRQEPRNAMLLGAVRSLLEVDADLARPGPRRNVLGRLLASVDFPGSARARQWVTDAFANDAISSSNLWVFTSLLAASPKHDWFTDALVLAPNATMSVRRRAADDILKIWPPMSEARAQLERSRERGLIVDGVLRQEWSALADRLRSQPRMFDPLAATREIEYSARLNEAAALLAVDAVDRAETMLRELNTELDQIDLAPGTTSSSASGSPAFVRPSAQDGAWSAAYELARRNTEERLKLLGALGSQSISDLNEQDAATLVREAYRASPGEVRDAAQNVILDRLINGPTVVMQLVDLFPEAPRSQSTTDFIARVSGYAVPSYRDESWPVECRLALRSHAIEVIAGDDDDSLDSVSAQLADAYARTAAVMRGAEFVNSPVHPLESLERLREIWRDLAHSKVVAEPLPHDLPTLDRKHQVRMRLAEGPIQACVAHQITILELTAYVTAAERGSVHLALRQLLDDSVSSRRRATSVLEQAVELERAITEIWRLRLGADERKDEEEPA